MKKKDTNVSGSISRKQIIQDIANSLKYRKKDVELVLNAYDEIIIREILCNGVFDSHGIFYIYTTQPKTSEPLKKYNVNTGEFTYSKPREILRIKLSPTIRKLHKKITLRGM